MIIRFSGDDLNIQALLSVLRFTLTSARLPELNENTKNIRANKTVLII